MTSKARACPYCPGVTFDDRAAHRLHYNHHHRPLARVQYADGATVTVQRNEDTKLLHCHRCPLTFTLASSIQAHAASCFGSAESDVREVDDAALQRMGLRYEAAHQALICIPCQSAVALKWIGKHWLVTPEHADLHSTYTVKDVRSALQGNPAILVNELAPPDPFGPAIASLAHIMANRCTLCDWCGPFPVRHWSRVHATRVPNSNQFTPAMPLELSRLVKLQRWSSVSDWFPVELGGTRARPNAVQAPPSTQRTGAPASQRAAASSSSASTPRTQAARPAPLIARRPQPRPHVPAPPAQSADVHESSASTSTVRPRPRPRATAAAAQTSGKKRSAAARRKRAAWYSSEEEEDELGSCSSRAASNADSDWEKRDVGGDSDEDDWDERELTPDWMLEQSDEESEWIYGDDENDGNVGGIEDAPDSVAVEAALLDQSEVASDVDANGEAAPEIVHERRSRSTSASRSRSKGNAGEKSIADSRASSSPSIPEQDWQAGPIRPSISPPPASPDRAFSPFDSVSGLSADLSSVSQAAPLQGETESHFELQAGTQRAASLALPAQRGESKTGSYANGSNLEHLTRKASSINARSPQAIEPWRVVLAQLAQATQCELTTTAVDPRAHPQPAQVATFLNSLLALATVVLTPQSPTHQQQPSVHPSRRSELEAIVNSAASIAQVQRQLVSVASKPAASRSSFSRSASASAPTSLASSSAPNNSRSSLPASSISHLQDSVCASTHASSEIVASTAFSSCARSAMGQQRSCSREPSVDDAGPSSKRCKVE